MDRRTDRNDVAHSLPRLRALQCVVRHKQSTPVLISSLDTRTSEFICYFRVVVLVIGSELTDLS